mgnify:CR=1 FL=1
MKKDFRIKEGSIYFIISILLFFEGLHLRFTGYPYGPKNESNWYVIAGVIIVNLMNFINNISNKRKYGIIASAILLLFCILFLLIPQIKLFSVISFTSVECGILSVEWF